MGRSVKMIFLVAHRAGWHGSDRNTGEGSSRTARSTHVSKVEFDGESVGELGEAVRWAVPELANFS